MRYIFSALIITLMFPLFSVAETYRAIYIIDGDTLYVEDGQGKRIKVRLKEVDTPEMDQAYGKVSHRKLTSLCLGKTVQLKERGIGKKGRPTARVYCDGVYADKYLAKYGHAWVFVTRSSDLSVVKAYQSARNRRVGLWESRNPVAPWEHRKQKQKQKRNWKTNAFFNAETKTVNYQRYLKNVIDKKMKEYKF